MAPIEIAFSIDRGQLAIESYVPISYYPRSLIALAFSIAAYPVSMGVFPAKLNFRPTLLEYNADATDESFLVSITSSDIEYMSFI